MSLPIRIRFEDQDFTYRILTKHFQKDTDQIKIEVEGEEFTMIKHSNNTWHVSESSINDNYRLLEAIVKAICLRYRI